MATKSAWASISSCSAASRTSAKAICSLMASCFSVSVRFSPFGKKTCLRGGCDTFWFGGLLLCDLPGLGDANDQGADRGPRSVVAVIATHGLRSSGRDGARPSRPEMQHRAPAAAADVATCGLFHPPCAADMRMRARGGGVIREAAAASIGNAVAGSALKPGVHEPVGLQLPPPQVELLPRQAYLQRPRDRSRAALFAPRQAPGQ
jgi:hypothetical protein